MLVHAAAGAKNVVLSSLFGDFTGDSCEVVSCGKG